MSTTANNATVIPLHASKRFHSSRTDTVMKATIQDSLTTLPQSLQQIYTVAHMRFKVSIQRLFDHVDDALFELADRAASNLEQNVFFESMRELRIQRRNMEASFLEKIDQSFVTLISDNIELGQTDKWMFGVTEFDTDTNDLSIMEKDELEELVAIDSLVSKSLAKNKSALRSVGLRIGSLLSSPISEKNNPFFPRLLANNFVDSSSKINIDIKAKLVLFKLFERYVMNDLASILNEVNQVLTEQGVPVPSARRQMKNDIKNASKNISRPYPPVINVQHGTPSAQKPSTPDLDADHGLYTTLQSLLKPQREQGREQGREQESYDLNADQTQFSNTQYPANSISYRLLMALSQLQQQQLQGVSVAAGLSEGETKFLTSQHIQSAIESAAGEQSIDERSQDVIKLVDMLFSYILEDGNLLDPVKLLLSRLQIPFIKVAIVDEEFFNKEGHPARRLLNEMATASIGLTGDLNSTKPDILLTKIESIVTKVLEQFDSDPDIFTFLLTDFIAFQEKEKRRCMLFEKRAIDAEDGKAKAEMARQKVHEKLSELMTGKQVPDVFTSFIYGPWSNILFLIYMRQGDSSKQWDNTLSVARELIWTATSIKNDAHKDKLKKMLPRLQILLKKGLESISFNLAKQSQFFDKFDRHYETLINTYQQSRELSVKAKESNVASGENLGEALDKELDKGLDEELDDTVIVEFVDEVDDPHVEQSELNKDVMHEYTDVVSEDKSTSAADQESGQELKTNYPHSEHPQPSEPESRQSSELSSESSNNEKPQLHAERLAEPDFLSAEEPTLNDVKNVKNESEELVADTQYLNLVDNFTIGVWFEKVAQDSTPYRCRLAAIIRGAGKYIFVNRAGIKVAEETRDTLALQLQRGHLRILDDGMLFDRALESVISNLRRKN